MSSTQGQRLRLSAVVGLPVCVGESAVSAAHHAAQPAGVAMLLGMAFGYDEFFVFVSPLLLFDSSVMKQVAVGSLSRARIPITYCEKYHPDGESFVLIQVDSGDRVV